MRQIKTLVLSALIVVPTSAVAQARPFEIMDNSFLVEEAFNQPAGVFQNILFAQRSSGAAYDLQFTQEWPLRGQRHQLSYTLPVALQRSEFRLGSIALHYRLQLLAEAARSPAFSPRLSLLLPTGDASRVGVQFNLPASKQFGDVYLHGNAGYTFNETDAAHVAGSAILRVRPLFHLMVESVFVSEQNSAADSFVISPGFRAGWNIGDKQLVFGIAVPLGLLDADDATSFITYFSYELPFK